MVGAAVVLACWLAAAAAPQPGAPPGEGKVNVPAPTGAAEEAPAPREEDISLITLVVHGGVLMIPIGICSVVALAYIIERFIRLRRSQVMPAAFIRAMEKFIASPERDNGRGLELCRAHPSPIARIFEGAFRRAGRSTAEIEKAIEDAGQREVNRLKQNVRILSTVANIAPLLGLLGTVFGMIRAFAKIRSEAGLGKPELLAGGIYEALVTTAAGLSVAIPALAMYYYFSHKIEKMVREIDELTPQVVEAIAAGSRGERAG